MRPLRRQFARLGITLALCLSLAACSNLFFVPMKTLLRSPDELGMDFENVFIDSSDAVRLYGWFLPAEGTARGSILFLHGNAENISTHIGSVYWLPARGYNVLLLDYRGYGLSDGQPSLSGAIADVQAALRWLLVRTDNGPIVVLGQSLGGSLGVTAIAEADQAKYIDALIIDSAFSDYRLIAREKLGDFWLTWPLQYPLSWLISARYNPIDAIARISPTPVLIIHGEDDHIVPPHHAHLLYQTAEEPKQLWLVPGSGHIAALGHPDIRDRLVDYLDRSVGHTPKLSQKPNDK